MALQEAVASGLGQLIGGASAVDVGKAIARDGLLNLIPVWWIKSIGEVVIQVVGAVTGKNVKAPVLGLLLEPSAKTTGGGKAAVAFLRQASERYAEGWAGYGPPGRALGPLFVPRDATRWADDWVTDLYDRLANALDRGGPAEIERELRTSAITLQALHAAGALYEWAKATQYAEGEEPASAPTVQAGYLGSWLNASAAPEPAQTFGPGDLVPLKGKWAMFKRLGLPSYQSYAAAIAEAQGAPAETPGELFPGAVAGGVVPLEELVPQVDVNGYPLPQSVAPFVSVPVQSAAVGVSKAPPAVVKQKLPAPVVVGLGGVALLLALL